MIKAVIFDFDGVIGDTMNDHFKAWKKAMADYNIKITKKEYFELEGLDMFSVASKLSEGVLGQEVVFKKIKSL